MELANDVFGASTRLAEDAVASDDLVAVHLVLGAERGQLMEYRLRGIGGSTDERRAVAAAGLPGSLDPALTTLTKALGEKRGESCEPSNRVAQIDLLIREAIELGWFSLLASALTGHEVPQRHEALKMAVRDRSVHSDRFRDIVDGPLTVMRVEVEEDPSSGRVLKGADDLVQLCQMILPHAGTLFRPIMRQTQVRWCGSPSRPRRRA